MSSSNTEITGAEVEALQQILPKVWHAWRSGKHIPLGAFYAICNNLITCPVELAVVFREGGVSRLLLHYREDEYYKAWHIPGMVLLPGETAEDKLEKIVKKEIGDISFSRVGTPVFLGAFDKLRGTGDGECPRGQEVSRVYGLMVDSQVDIYLDETKKFVSVDAIDHSLLIPEHRGPIINTIIKWAS